MTRDGKYLVTGGGSPRPGLWTLADGKFVGASGDATVTNAQGEEGYISSLIASEDSRYLFSVYTVNVRKPVEPNAPRANAGISMGRIVLQWDLTTRKLMQRFVHPKPVSALAVSSDGSLVATAAEDAVIRLWDVRSGRLLRSYSGFSSLAGYHYAAIRIGRDKLVAFGGKPGILVLDLQTFERIQATPIPELGGYSVDVSSDGRWGVRAGLNNGWKLELWDLTKGVKVRDFSGLPESYCVEIDSVAVTPDGKRIMVCGYSVGLKIWDGATGQLLTTSLVGEHDAWITITDSGHFLGSQESSQWLSVVRGLEAYSVRQFYDQLYRPDLVEEVLKGDPEGKYKDEAFRLNLQKILDSGPAPEIERLKERDARAGDTYRLAVRLTDVGGGIGDKVVWRVGDQVRAVSKVRLQSGTATDKAATVTASIPVDPGKDTLVEVTAYNGAGLLASLPYQIRIDKFGATTEERPRMYVLAIGVSKYRMPDYELKLAAKDATAFGSALKKVSGGLFGADKVFVTTLLDEQVTKKGIEAAFDEIAGRAKLGDVFVLYLSGHGKSVAGRYYYYPQTLDFAHGQRVEQDGVGQDAWQVWIARIAAQKKVLIIDTCESSAAGGLVKGSVSTQRTAMDQLQHATGENLIAAARQAAFEGWHGHGVLTYALLEAMNKTQGSDERIKVAGLASYVDERVPEISQQLTGLYQRPTYRLSGSDFPIGIRQAVLTPEAGISSTPTHVVVRNARVREQAAVDAQGERELSPGTQVRVLKFEGAWALVAREGQKLGFAPAESLLKLQ